MDRRGESRATMPSRAFSGTELGTAHNRLLAAKKEMESDDELDEKIQETREFCSLAHQQLWFYVVVGIDIYHIRTPSWKGVPEANQRTSS